MNNIIAIDGPSGVGKTSTALLVAQRLHLTYLPSGKLFRAIAFLTDRNQVDIHDKKQLTDLLDLDGHNFDIKPNGHLLLNGQDISDKLNEPEIGSKSTIIAQDHHVRKYLLELQRKIGASGCVIEGRSTAVEVFPEADTKIWLTADEKTRISRKRQAEGEESAGAALTRDEIDKERRLAPMQKAEGAITIDTTHISLQQVVDLIVQSFEKRHNVLSS